MKFKDKKFYIIGLGDKGTGRETAKLLLSEGANITISDTKSHEELKHSIDEILTLGDCVFKFGEHAYEDIENADTIIISPGVPSFIPPLVKARALNIPIISEVELAYRLLKAPIIGITGTKGKTTTTTLTGLIAKKCHTHNVFVGGNIGLPLVSVAKTAKAEDLIIAELSSFQLENIIDFHPHVAVFTNLYEDHLDRYNNSIEEYFQAKLKIFQNQTEEDFAIVNTDLEVNKKVITTTRAKIIPVSLKEKVTGGIYLKNSTIMSSIGNVQEPIIDIEQIRIKGQHNLANVMCAIAANLAIGLPVANCIGQVLAEFKGVENRLEEVATINGISFYNDSQGTTPMAVEMALSSFKEKSVVLIAGGRAKVSNFNELGSAIATRAKSAILIGEAKEVIANAILKFAPDFNLEYADTLPDAVTRAYNHHAKAGDNVVLSPACASFDMFKNMEERGKVFKETVIKIVDGID